MSNGVKRNKRIFISDIHMGDEKSLNPGPGYNPYVWIKPPRTDLLIRFLDERILQSQDVKELVLLGDVFDQWVCPTEFEPTTYDKIATAPQNVGVIAKLAQIAASGIIKLSIVPGNHDMLIDEVSKKFFDTYIPGTIYLGRGPGLGAYESGDGISGEHGSMYTMFNSPDTWSNPPGWLPLGSYISRLAAHKNAVMGEGPDTFDIAIRFIKQLMHNPELGRNVFLAIAGDVGLGPQTPIIMNGLDNVPGSITVQEVADRYADLVKNWKPVPPLDITPGEALANEITGLDGPAQSQYFLKGKAKIVVFGHTHTPILCAYLRGDNYCTLSLEPGKPCDFIYANSGTWINSHKQGSYVETELDEDKGKHHVWLYFYSETGKISKYSHRWIKV